MQKQNIQSKNNLFKNIFYILFALCFFSAGIFTIAKTENANVAVAKDVSNDEVSNENIPEYFLAQEFIHDASRETEENYVDEINENSLIKQNTFMFFTEGSFSNYLKLSLNTNGVAQADNEIYNYVYYPDPSDTSFFHFFHITNMALTINGQLQTLDTSKNYVQQTDFSFRNLAPSDNASAINLHGFSMVFNNSGEAENEFNILDESGEVKEGIYTLSLRLALFTCTDGRDDGNEESFLPETQVEINFSFYVLNRDSYLTNNRPNLSKGEFDNEVASSDASSQNAYTLYSNYTSDYTSPNKTGSSTKANQIPYIEYDFTRFELDIRKELSTEIKYASLQFDKDYDGDAKTSPIVSSGSNIVLTKINTQQNKCRVYFTDVGIYTLSLKAIKLVDFRVVPTASITELRKYSLPEINTKKIVVHMFGYQAGYTDFDQDADDNNIRPTAELKKFEVDTNGQLTGGFINSADITSQFVNSQPNYSQENYNTTFTRNNILRFLNTSQRDENGNLSYKYNAIKTNQTPIKFAANATLMNGAAIQSYILTTSALPGYSNSGLNLHGTPLYQKAFTGQTENVAGTYIYIISYTYKDYTNSSKVFYQVFFFEIEKGTPSISVKYQNGTDPETGAPKFNEVFSYDFINKDVVVTDTANKAFNKDVTVQLYAYDYVTEQYKTEFGGEYGIAMSTLIENGGLTDLYTVSENNAEITLHANAHYTIRLYYTSDIKNGNLSTSINSKTGFTSSQYFTIDQQPIENIFGRNVTETANGYQIINDIAYFSSEQNQYVPSFATNQSMVISWDKKLSGASSYAYYRYFPLATAQYYSQDLDNISNLLMGMLSQKVLPVGSVLNLDANNKNKWIPLAGNVSNGGNSESFQRYEMVPSEYVLSDAGLYLVDIYDEAGNHKVDLFLIDNTSPIFAIYNGQTSKYELTSQTTYINKNSTLYWADYKGIYIANFNSQIYRDPSFDIKNLDNIQLNEFYKDKDNNISAEIYDLIKNKLFSSSAKHMQYLSTNVSKLSNVSELIDSYSSMYMTIKIDDVSYFTDNQHAGVYVKQLSSETNNRKLFEIAEEELTYRVLIRDLSNTKYDLTTTDTNGNILEDDAVQYTKFFSARQTIKISFDDSKFVIKYQKADQTYEEFPSFLTESDKENSTQTTYLSPTNLESAFSLSFVPTSTDESGSKTTQVEDVTITYYRYETAFKKDETTGITYYYKALVSDEEAITYPVYSFDTHGQNTSFEVPIGISGGMTAPGKYIITRSYINDAEKYTINSKDFLKRTYVLIVDRFDVITGPETTPSGNSESLVGGDIFVAMFDNGISSSIVVTAPNSNNGNTDGKAIYDGKLLLTTNKLPVNLYIPQYKYTTHVTSNNYEENGFDVGFDFTNGTDTMNNYKDQLLIKEYALFAQLFKNGTTEKDLIANTFLGGRGSTVSDIAANENGFMIFYNTKTGERLGEIKETGTYYVRIYQGRFGTDVGENSYEQSITFSFVVESATPNFSAQLVNGATLKSVTNDKITAEAPYAETYHTNQSEICLTWNASSDEYMVEIDVDNIKLATSNKDTFQSSDNIWTVRPYEQDNHTYLAQLNLEKLTNVYVNGGWVDITMQFKNHDDNYYKKVTKRVYVDLSAPNENINNLVSKSTSGISIAQLTESALRIHQTAKFQTANNPNEICYNTSNSSGMFANYSYMVSNQFLAMLKASKSDFQASEIFVRKFENGRYINGEEETSPTSFSQNNFEEINNLNAFDSNTYYEVVETDRAGNMTIYTIYVMDYEKDTNIISYNWTDNSDGEVYSKAYTEKEYQLVKQHSGAIHNIYSKTGFRLSNVNFFGDEWAQIKLDTFSARGDKTTRTLMLTPYDKGYALMFEGNSTPQRIALSSLIDGNSGSIYKNVMSIYNRETADKENLEKFYITIYNTSLSASLTQQQDEEYIRFNKISDNEIQNPDRASVYLTSLSITAFDAGNNTGNLIYGSQADANQLVAEGRNPLGYVSYWTSNSNVVVDTKNALVFNVVNTFSPNTRIIYEFKDNYGTTYKEVHIYHESIISKEISSENDLYSFLDDGTEYYITSNGFQYTYNPSKYSVQVSDVLNGAQTSTVTYTSNLDGTRTITVHTTRAATYNDTFILEINDASTNKFIKRIHFKLYNQLPIAGTNSTGSWRILDANGNNITDKIVSHPSDDEYFSEVRIMYNLAQTFIPVKFSISTDRINWSEIASGTRLQSQSESMEKYYLKVWYDETFLPNENGNSQYVFGHVPEEQIFEFNLSSLTATYWVEKTMNGVTSILEKSNMIFQSTSGMQYTNHYLVNLDYSQNSAVEIKVNKEQEIEATHDPLDTFIDGNVVSELWLISNRKNATSNIPVFETYIVITYIPPSTNFVEGFYATNENGILENDNLVSKTSTSVIVSQEQSGVDKVQLQWSKYYGIIQNEIEISIMKDGIKLDPEIFTKRSGNDVYSYTYLSYSGKYTISLHDKAGNIQKFNAGSSGQTEYFTFVFLKDVPFTVTYTKPGTEETETSLPIQQAVYNSAVTLNIDESTRSEFYVMGKYPKISSIKKNGVEIEKTFPDNASSFTFEDAGYYSVTLTATSKNRFGEEVVLEKTFQFTILNPAEHKFSYVYNQYSNYYVERVLKNGQDITEFLLQNASNLGIETIQANGKEHLSQLPLSYDGLTGAGTYTITINSNNQFLKGSSLISSWTFIVTINQGTAPLQISLAEGQSTTKSINVSFNRENIFAEMGECSIRIIRQNENGSLTSISTEAINAQSNGTGNATIDSNGTFYIQIVSPSGVLLFSYKVTKTAPMNAASIIAIVISAIVLIAVIFIVYKLRKRISVK